MIKLLLLTFLAITEAGCRSIPHRTIVVTDDNGNPIRGAGVRAPYPMLLRNMVFRRDSPSANSTDSRGRLALYDMTPGLPDLLGAGGYEDKEISFPENNRQTYILHRKQKHAPNTTAQTTAPPSSEP